MGEGDRSAVVKPSGQSLLDVAAVAARLGTTVPHVRRLVYERRIPFLKLGDGAKAPVRFDPVEIEVWLDAHRYKVERR